jgi:thiopeptide-type bacteriocin biosynthesis protein
MSDSKRTDPFTASGFFALRTPLLPFDELLTWGEGLEAPLAVYDPARLEEALAADRARLRTRLRDLVSRPEVREALFVASPDLEERLDVWLNQPDSEPGQKMERALVRYFARMAGRATPFGLFAGCSVGTLGPQTRLELAGRGGYRRHTRLDMDYLVLLTDALARELDVRPALSFGVNTSLYPAQGRLRYLEVRRDGKGWTHHQMALEASGYLEATLARAREGVSREALAAGLVADDPEASREEAREYIDGLIDSQVLVSELRPAVTGPEPVGGLVERLRARGRRAAADLLDEARRQLEALDAGGLGADPSCYRRLAGLLEGLPGKPDLARLFQVDMVKPVVQASLGPAVLAEILRGAMLLQRLARRPRDDRLARFREAFANRYEGREVPLVEALDAETGVGFGTLTAGATDASALLDGLTFPRAEDEQVPWRRREVLLLGKLSEALAHSARAIVLEPRDLEEMAEKDPPPLPDAFAVMATVAASSEADLARGEFQVLLDGAVGPSGARLLGRFCHADPQLHRWVEQHLRAEEALEPDAVFAEVVHLAEGRLGNVLARPVLRAYEIPYLGSAGVPAERQIPAADLRVSVRGDRIVLRSARLGRRVIPRLTSAHNYEMSQGLYSFLGALQSQGAAGGLGWDWGPLRDAPFLPRVVSGRLVLSRASWQVGEDEWKPLAQTRGAARFRRVQSWRRARGLPRWIALADADNELPTDLDNALAAETLVELVKGRKQVRLVELFPGPDQLCARGPEGRFVHEVVVPFVRVPEPTLSPPTPLSRGPGRGESVARSFPPGSEWLFIKLYAGPATADHVLRDVVRPVIEWVMPAGAADRWFFVRYGDPDWHLRLRFHGLPARLGDEVLPALQAAAAPLVRDGRLWRLQLDTYEREVERYGGAEGIVLAERLFQADSEAVLALSELLPEDARGDVRWRLALVGMDLLLSDLGFDFEARRAVLHKSRDTFAAEFHAGPEFGHQLAAKFRPERKGLEALLAPAASADAPFAAALEILRRRSQVLAPVMAKLRACAQAGRLSVSLTELAPSYLHMHANRMLRSAQRAQELVLYDFLGRLYQSQAARRPCAGAPRRVPSSGADLPDLGVPARLFAPNQTSLASRCFDGGKGTLLRQLADSSARWPESASPKR